MSSKAISNSNTREIRIIFFIPTCGHQKSETRYIFEKIFFYPSRTNHIGTIMSGKEVKDNQNVLKEFVITLFRGILRNGTLSWTFCRSKKEHDL